MIRISTKQQMHWTVIYVLSDDDLYSMFSISLRNEYVMQSYILNNVDS